MISAKHRTAEALAPMLSAFHSLRDLSLHAVWQVYTEASLGKIILDLGQRLLIIVADENDESIDVTVTETADPNSIGGVDGSSVEPRSDLLGKSFGWGWATVNQQGYCDGLLLSFEGIAPQIVLNVVASSIKIGTISSASL